MTAIKKKSLRLLSNDDITVIMHEWNLYFSIVEAECNRYLIAVNTARLLKFRESWQPSPIFGLRRPRNREMQNLRAVDLGLSGTGKPTVHFFSFRNLSLWQKKSKSGSRTGSKIRISNHFSRAPPGLLNPSDLADRHTNDPFVRSKRGKKSNSFYRIKGKASSVLGIFSRQPEWRSILYIFFLFSTLP